MARIAWFMLATVAALFCLTHAAEPPPPEVGDQSPRQEAPAAPPIDWREVAKRGVIGKLGHPLGATLRIEGVAMDGADTRVKSWMEETLLRVQRVNNVTLKSEVWFVFSPFQTGTVESPKPGERFKFVGYEGGGFTGITQAESDHIGEVAGTAWAFETWFSVVAEFDPDVAIIDIASDRPPGNVTHLRIVAVDADDPFLAELYDFAIKRFPEGTWVNFGPDSSYREVIFLSRGRKIHLQSWHPVFEKDPRLVAGSRGITSLGTQSREEFLEQDDQDYVAKRNAFDEIEARLWKHYGK